MEWFSENWIWVVVAIAMVAMHAFGHGGHGGHGGHRRRDEDERDAPQRGSTPSSGGHRH
jgi:hypothetical protein